MAGFSGTAWAGLSGIRYMFRNIISRDSQGALGLSCRVCVMEYVGASQNPLGFFLRKVSNRLVVGRGFAPASSSHRQAAGSCQPSRPTLSGGPLSRARWVRDLCRLSAAGGKRRAAGGPRRRPTVAGKRPAATHRRPLAFSTHFASGFLRRRHVLFRV